MSPFSWLILFCEYPCILTATEQENVDIYNLGEKSETIEQQFLLRNSEQLNRGFHGKTLGIAKIIFVWISKEKCYLGCDFKI